LRVQLAETGESTLALLRAQVRNRAQKRRALEASVDGESSPVAFLLDALGRTRRYLNQINPDSVEPKEREHIAQSLAPRLREKSICGTYSGHFVDSTRHAEKMRN
jgi:hypothetical protein